MSLSCFTEGRCTVASASGPNWEVYIYIKHVLNNNINNKYKVYRQLFDEDSSKI